MTRDDFKTIIKGLKAAYPNDTFVPDVDSFEVWFAALGEFEYKAVAYAANKYLMNEHFPPAIADIRALMPQTEMLNEEEAWNLAIKAIRNSAYNAEEEFSKLPETVQKVVVSPGNLHTLATMNRDELHTVEKSHFMRTYRVEAERTKQNMALPEKMRGLLESAMPQLPG